MHIAVQPCGDSDARNHYVDTIANLVKREKIAPHLSAVELSDFDKVCGEEVAVWGVTKGIGEGNLKKWRRLLPGDIVLLYQDRKLFSKARITFKVQNESLAKSLWSTKVDGTTWECIYFLDNLEEIEVPVSKFNEVLSYKPTNIIQGFNVYEAEAAEKLISLLEIPNDELGTAEQVELSTQQPGKSLAEQLKSLDSLDYSSARKSRAEMGIFRKHLFSGADVAKCDLCGQLYPVGFLVAAHIKKRASCTDEQKRDLSVVMKACIFGCDALYERSYVYVDASGSIQSTAEGLSSTDDVKSRVASLTGRKCTAFSADTDGYFEWHRTHPRRLLK